MALVHSKWHLATSLSDQKGGKSDQASLYYSNYLIRQGCMLDPRGYVFAPLDPRFLPSVYKNTGSR